MFITLQPERTPEQTGPRLLYIAIVNTWASATNALSHVALRACCLSIFRLPRIALTVYTVRWAVVYVLLAVCVCVCTCACVCVAICVISELSVRADYIKGVVVIHIMVSWLWHNYFVHIEACPLSWSIIRTCTCAHTLVHNCTHTVMHLDCTWHDSSCFSASMASSGCLSPQLYQVWYMKWYCALT